MAALGFKSGFQGVVFLFEFMERVQFFENLLIFNTFSIWNVPWHVAVTTSVLSLILAIRLSEDADEIADIKQVSRSPPRLMSLKRSDMTLLDSSSNCVGGYPEKPAGFRNRDSAGRGSGRICHQLLSVR